MKTKSFILLVFTSFTITGFAQSEKEVEKENKWQISVNVNTVEPASDAGFDYNTLSQRTFINGHRKDNSYCVGLIASYKVKENCAVRLSAKMTNYKITETRDYREFPPSPQMTGAYEISFLDAKQSVFAISPGILWNSNFSKLNFYGGFQLVYKKYSSIIGNTNLLDYDYPSNILTIDRRTYQTEPGGFSTGVGPVAGFSVNQFKSISIGAEFSTAYSYYKTGGAITSTTTFFLPNYVSPASEISEQTFQGFGFSSLLTTINIAINF